MEQQLGPYLILGKLAAGGMATVYVARHVRLENIVGLKVLHAHYQQDDQLRTRFVDEARIQANLRHDNILQVQDILELPDASAMVMELLEGCALDSFYRARGRPIPLPRALGLFLPLLDALSHAHDQGVVHRDLKPSNVFLHCRKEDVVPKLMDFGIAKLQSQAVESQVTAAGSMLGTPQYMAPEQFEDSSKVDTRADQFAIGVMLYEATVGTVPFGGENVAEIMKGVLTRAPVPPSAVVDGYPPALEAIVLRCLEKRREDRFESVDILRKALAELSRELGSEPLPLDQVPRIDLREKGIDITTPITSSKMRTRPDSNTRPQRPDGEHQATVQDTSPRTDDSWTDRGEATLVESRIKRKGRWGKVVATLVVLTLLAGAAWLFWPRGGKGKKPAPSTPAVAATEEPARAEPAQRPGTGTLMAEEEPDAPPLGPLPRRKGLQLGTSCNPNATALTEKIINARLLGGWRGKRLSRMAERQLNQLGVTREEEENFKVIRAENAFVRETDRLAIAASVTPFKTSPLTAKDLEHLERKLARSDELRRYVETRVDYLCRSYPLQYGTSNPDEVGALYPRILAEHGFAPMEFMDLHNAYADDRFIQAECSARAVCCLLSGDSVK